MMKKFVQSVLGLLAGFAEVALASKGEFGEQDMVPMFVTNTDYSGLSATKYIFVQGLTTAARQAIQATAPTSSTLLGVMQNNPARGEAMSIARSGLSKVVAGGALTANWIITSNSSGRAARVTSGDFAAGMVLEAAVSDGDVVTALLFTPMRWSGAA